MKVLLLNQIPEVNNKYTFSLARGLKESGINVKVCGIETDDVSSYSDIPFKGLFESYSVINNPLKKVDSYRKSWNRTFNYCVSNKFDIVHVQWYIFSPLDCYYHNKLRKNGIKVVATIHDLIPFDKKPYDIYYLKKIYSKANAVITQAQKNIDTLKQDFGVKEEKITYIPHGHYMDYVENSTKEESRNYLNIPMDKKVILFFGQIKKVKGVGVLIDAMQYVIKKHPDALCLIAGKVWHDDFSEYEKQISELHLKNNIRTDIRFIDDDEIKYYFNAADIVALPYLESYQSGVVQLAYAYEKPVVATSEGEFLNVVKNNETGLLVSAGNSQELANAIIWYLDNPMEAKEYAKDGKIDIDRRYNWTSIAKKVSKLYYETVTRPIKNNY